MRRRGRVEITPVRTSVIVPVLDAPSRSLSAALPKDRHPAAVYLARLAPGSRRTISMALDRIAQIISNGSHDARSLSWASLRYQHTQAIRSVLMERYEPAGANLRLAALRGVLKETWRLGQISSEDYQRAIDLPSIRSVTLPKGRALSTGELRSLFEVCAQDATPAGRRDAALLATLYAGGLRRSEVIALDLADYTPESGELRIRRGKGRKDRLVYVPGGAEALTAWLQIRGDAPGALFFAVGKGGRVRPHRITGQAVWKMLLKRAAEAGVKRFSPHDLRRTFIGDLLTHGADLSTVQALAGHATVATTAKYDRRGEVTKQRAAGMLHVPYVVAVKAGKGLHT